MKILHIAPIDYIKISGLNTAIGNLLEAQSKKEDVQIALLMSTNRGQEIILKKKYNIYSIKDLGDNKKISNLPCGFSNPDLVVFHSLYIPIHVKLSRELKKRKIPYIIMPHGGMSRKALFSKKRKVLKKMAANFFVFNGYIKNSQTVHFLNENELKMAKYYNGKSFIEGNGISRKEFEKNSNTIISPEKKSKIVITCIARLDVKIKGLDLMVDAVGLLDKKILENIEINLYGPITKEEKAFLEKSINQYRLSRSFKIHNPVNNKEKIKIFSNTDIFILTSRTEGHPMSIIEAMSFGKPCLITKGTNFFDIVEKENCGWVAENNSNSICLALQEVAKSKQEDIKVKGENAKKVVEKNFLIDKIAENIIGKYKSEVVSYKKGNKFQQTEESEQR